MTEEKKYWNLEELLPQGEHLLKVYPQGIWDDTAKEYSPNTLKSGSFKNGGNWFMYSTPITKEMTTVHEAFGDKEKLYIKCFANDKNHEAFKTGFVKAVIVPKKDSNGDMNYDKDGNPKLTTFFNQLTPAELELAKEGNVVSAEGNAGEEISVDDLSF